MDLGSDTTHRDLATAAKLIFARNGYSLAEAAAEVCDFCVYRPQKPMAGVTCLFQGAGVSTMDAMEAIKAAAAGGLTELYLITQSTFQPGVQQVINATHTGPHVTLVDIDDLQEALSFVPRLLTRLGIVPAASTQLSPALSDQPVAAQIARKPWALPVALAAVLCLMASSAIITAVSMSRGSDIEATVVSQETRDRKNAQTIASVYGAAKAAGLDFAAADRPLSDVVHAITEGDRVSAAGPMKGVTFRAHGIDKGQASAAARYLELSETGDLFYVDKSEDQPATEASPAETLSTPSTQQQSESLGSAVQPDADTLPIELPRELIYSLTETEAENITSLLNQAKERENIDFLQMASGDKDRAVEMLLSNMKSIRVEDGSSAKQQKSIESVEPFLPMIVAFITVDGGKFQVEASDEALARGYRLYREKLAAQAD